MKISKAFLPIFSLVFFVFISVFTGCKKEAAAPPAPDPNTIYPLKVTFQNKVGAQPLVLNTSYTNAHGENYKITDFKYYISNVILVEEGGSETKLPNTYFLIDAANTSSTSFTLNTKGYRFKTVRFLVGVDSTRNVSGVQTGALDPANGMFWTWSTGYIMAKLDGTYTSGTISALNFAYDIGGFLTGENVTRQVSLSLPNALVLKSTATSELVVAADANAWFKGAYDVKLATDPVSLNPGPLAMKIADNYARMFSVTEVINK